MLGDLELAARADPGHGRRSSDGRQQIQAMVPEASCSRYALDLRSLTGGRGAFEAEHDHYDVLPPHLVERIASTAQHAGAH